MSILIPDLSQSLPETEIDLTLRFSDDYEGTFNRNANNQNNFSQIRSIICDGVVTCYFQKYKADEKSGESRHKIIIPIGQERAIEAIVKLWEHKIDTFNRRYSYRVNKFKEANFFNEPQKDTVKQKCRVKFTDVNERIDAPDEAFQKLYQTINNYPIPQVDLNKEKDKAIWEKYVTALKKLVKQKEQVWKISSINRPYAVTKDDGTGRATFIDIFIDEKELSDKFGKSLKNLFKPSEIHDSGVNDDKAFIEFNNYRELSAKELTQLKDLAEEAFYELSPNAPTHYLSGKIDFRFSDPESKTELLAVLQQKLLDDYQLEINLDTNEYINLQKSDIHHLQKIIDDNFAHYLTLRQDRNSTLKVSFKSLSDLQAIMGQIKEILNSDGLDKATVSSVPDQQEIIIAVSAFIPRLKFESQGLSFEKAVTRFEPFRSINLHPVNGLTLNNRCFELTNAGKEQVGLASDLLKRTFGIDFRRLPTQYYFKVNPKASQSTLRDFKTATDLSGKSSFSIVTSELTITADDREDFQRQIQRIQLSSPNAIIEQKPFAPRYQLVFKTELAEERQQIIGKLQAEINNSLTTNVSFDVVKGQTRILYYYEFKDEDDRSSFVRAISQTCERYKDWITNHFESKSGRTLYEMTKNETLELEREKEVRRNVSQATFIFLTPEQNKRLAKEIEQKGIDAYFKDGVQIGKLVRKDREKLRFQITEEFDQKINAREADRLDLTDVEAGFIKPIFPGELTNIGRMIRAMRKVTDPGKRNGFPVNPNLANFLFDPNESRLYEKELEEEKIIIAANLNEPLLRDQPKQLEAVAKTILAPELALIQGPPGTGKTTVIAELIWQTLLRNPTAKLLITSQTNLAVDNALERLKSRKSVRPIRVGNIEKFEDEGKVYANEKIKRWLHGKAGSDQEEMNKDNAVVKWIEEVKNNCSDDPKYSRAVALWKQQLDEQPALIKSTFAQTYHKHVNVFAATCSECGSRTFGDTYQAMFNKNSEEQGDPVFDLVIMDEASKATPPELVLPLTLGKKVVIIGDHKQLPPMIDEREFGEALDAVGAKDLIDDWTKDDYKVSQFEKLFRNAPKKIVTSLDTQFRMHEQIMNCISQFYSDQIELENGLICGIKSGMDVPDFTVKTSRWHGLKLEPFLEPKYHAIWINVDTPETKVGTSYENEGEAIAIKTIISALTQADGFQEYLSHFKKDEEREIGIITYYMPQMQRIRNTLYPHFTKNEWRNFEQHKAENEFGLPFRVNTVDRFQGMERNIVIISTVRSNKQVIDDNGRRRIVDNNKYPFALGFARELQRINVGFSRAKRLLIVIGNEAHFSNKPEYAYAIQKMHRLDIRQLQNLIEK